MYQLCILSAGTIIFWSFMRAISGPVRFHNGNPYSGLYYLTLLLTVLGLALVCIFHPSVNYLSLVTPDGLNKTCLSVAYSLVAFPIGMLIAEAIRGFKTRELTERFMNGSIKIIDGQAEKKITTTILVALSFLVLLYIYKSLPSVPILSLFDPNSSIATVRNDATTDFSGSTYIRNIFGLTFVPLASCVIYAWKRQYRSRLFTVGFVLSVLVSTVVLMFNLAKQPTVTYLLSLGMVKIYTGHGRKDGSRNFNMLILAAIVVLIAMYILIMRVSLGNLFDVWNPQSLMFRILLGQTQPLLLTFQIFPNTFPFQYGNSIFHFMNPGVLHPIPSRLVMQVLNPWGVNAGTAGFANSYYIGEAWANFGYVGVITFPIISGFYWHLLISLLITKYSPLRAGILGFIVFQLPIISQASAVRLIYTPELMISVLALLTCVGIGRIIVSALVNGREKSNDASFIHCG